MKYLSNFSQCTKELLSHIYNHLGIHQGIGIRSICMANSKNNIDQFWCSYCIQSLFLNSSCKYCPLKEDKHENLGIYLNMTHHNKNSSWGMIYIWLLIGMFHSCFSIDYRSYLIQSTHQDMTNGRSFHGNNMKLCMIYIYLWKSHKFYRDFDIPSITLM